MLKKSNRLGYTIQVGGDFLNVFKIIEAELKGKFTGMTNESLSRLKDVLSAAQKQNRLITFEVKHGKETVGGVLCLEKKDQLLYLKGASMELAKKNGAMYLLYMQR